MGLSTDLRPVPIKSVAQSLSIPLHQIDTFTSWTPPTPINLIIAVSFGRLVPPRLLSAAEYGGLNVHPSLLPDLRGPAPLQWTLLHRMTHTGVTLQTLHPQHFDQGTILAQTPWPGEEIPEAARESNAALLEWIAPKAADMLLQGIYNKVFVSPVKDVGWYSTAPTSSQSSIFIHVVSILPAWSANQEIQHSLYTGFADIFQDIGEEIAKQTIRYAPKLGPGDRRIDWTTWTAEDIVIRSRILGNLWDIIQGKRVIYGGFERVDGGHDRLSFKTADDSYVAPTSVTLEGEQAGKGLDKLRRMLRA
ncbi:Methionyl-tRNA formyltransferase [Elasticomyces elasticus]|nr:Methionyl-tRNA formyltransferase [Elasticomyces elasticus]